MMLTRLAVHRPVGVAMCVVALVLLSAIALQNVGLELLPDLELPVAAVAVVYPGADPETVEALVTDPIEDAVSSVPGVRRVRSMSMENASLVIVDFNWGADMNAALRDLEARLSIARALLPAEATAPVVVQTDPSQIPLMYVAVRGGDDPVDLTRRVERYVVPRLQSLQGVASVEILGGTYEEISVRYDSAALQRYGVTPVLLQQILRLQNTVVPSGSVVDGETRYNVRAGRRIESLEDLKSQPIAQREASAAPALGLFALAGSLPVQLREVADVEVERAPRSGLTRVDGSEAVLLRILKVSGANTVEVSERIRSEARAIEQSDAGLAFAVISDQSDLIRSSLDNLTQSAITGAVLAVAILFLFLRSLASILIVATAIPLSLLGAVAILHLSGVTLNIMSLGGLAVAVGMLVDNAIVVIENMARHRGLGKGAFQAAAEGGSEVAGAVVASTFTTLVVFIPIAFMRDLTGQLFRDLAVAVSGALALSLIVALTVAPAAYSRWEGRRASRARRRAAPVKSPAPVAAGLREAAAARIEPDAGRPDSERESPFGPAQRLYARALRRWLAHRWLGPAVTGLLLCALVALSFGNPWIFLPATDGGLISVSLSLPPGTPVSETAKVVEAYERAIQAMPEVDTVLSLAGDQGSQELLSFSQALSEHEAMLTVVLVPHAERTRPAKAIADEIAGLRLREGVEVSVQSDRTSAGLGDDYYPGVTIHVTGTDLVLLRETAEKIQAELLSAGGFSEVTMSVGAPQPELFFSVTDRSFQGALSGGEPLTAGQVGLALRNHMIGSVATYIEHEGNRLPVVIRPRSAETASTEALLDFRVPGALLGDAGARPILGRIANLAEVDGPSLVDHLNRQRLVTIRAAVDGVGLSRARAVAEQAMARVPVPAGVTVEVAGLHRVIDETARQLTGVLLVGIVLVFAVMAAQFESVKQPLLLMVTVPPAFVGAIGALRLFDLPLSVPAAIALIALAGIAVNNGIVMIDYINRLRKEGFAPLEAVVEGATVRLRPILMTAGTTLFGLIPLAFATGHGSEFQVPIAVALIGGLGTSTVLTLFILPSLVLISSGGRSLRPVAAAVALAAVALGGVQGRAEAARPLWAVDGLAGAVVAEGEAPAFLAGARLAAHGGKGRFSIGAAGGFAAGSPVLVGLELGRYFPDSQGGVDFSARAKAWLKAVPAHEAEFSASWTAAASRGSLSLAHAAGPRAPEPWSGRTVPSAYDGWEASLWLEESPARATTWDRSISLIAPADDSLRWLVMNGLSARVEGIVRARAGAGLFLVEGRYYPVFRLDTAVSLLPQGEVELTLGPHTGPVPPGWPVFGAGYRGRLGGLDVAVRTELGAPTSGFAQRGYAAVHFAHSPYSLRVAWSAEERLSGVIALDFTRSF